MLKEPNSFIAAHFKYTFVYILTLLPHLIVAL